VKESPIIMQRVRKHIEGDPDPRSMYHMVEIRLATDESLLATCMMSDDLGLEKIADMLSAKRLPDEANRFRKMVIDSRRGLA
jgi:hypothetical protein